MSDSIRFNWPIPSWNADWQSWQDKFEDLILDIESTSFSNMESLKCIFNQIPNARVYDDSGTKKLELSSDLILVSRTNNMKVTVDSTTDLELIPYHFVGLTFPSGTNEEVTVEFELFNTADMDPDVQIFGYITDVYSINWFNGSVFADGDSSRPLFSFDISGLSSSDRVRVSAADTTAGYLSSKVTNGSGVTLSIINPGANEQLQIDAGGYWDRTAGTPGYLDPITATDTIRIGDGTVSQPAIASQTYPNTGIKWSATDNIDFVCDGNEVLTVYLQGVLEQRISFTDDASYYTGVIIKEQNTAGPPSVLNLISRAGALPSGSQLYVHSITNNDQSSLVEVESYAGGGGNATATLKSDSGSGTPASSMTQVLASGEDSVDCLIRSENISTNDSTVTISADGGGESNIYITSDGSSGSYAELGGDATTGESASTIYAVSPDDATNVSILSHSGGGGGGINATIDISAINDGAGYDSAIVTIKSTSAAGYAVVVIGDQTTEDVILSVFDSVIFRFDNVDKLNVSHSGDTLLFDTYNPDDDLSIWEFNHSKYAGTSEAAIEFNVLGSTGTSGSRFTVDSSSAASGNSSYIQLQSNGYLPVVDINSVSPVQGDVTEINIYSATDDTATINIKSESTSTGDAIVNIISDSTGADAYVNIAAEGSTSGLVLVGSSSTEQIAFTDDNSSAISGSWTNPYIPWSTSAAQWTTYDSNFGERPLLDTLNFIYASGGGGGVVEPAGQVVYGTGAGVDSGDQFVWDTVTETLIIGDNGTLYANVPGDSKLEVQNGISSIMWSADNEPPVLSLHKSLNATVGTHGAVNNNTILGEIDFYGSYGSGWREGSKIVCIAREIFTSGHCGSELRFYTTTIGTLVPAIAMIVQDNGYISVSNSSSISATAMVEVFGNGDRTYDNTLGISYFDSSASAQPNIRIRKSANDTMGSHTAVSSGDALGKVSFEASDGSAYGSAVELRAVASDTWNGSSYGGTFQIWQTQVGETTAGKTVTIYKGTEAFTPSSGYSSVYMNFGDDADHESLILRANNIIVFQDANTVSSSYMGGSLVIGSSNDFSSSYMSDSIVIGDSNTFSYCSNMFYRGNSNDLSYVQNSVVFADSTDPDNVNRSIIAVDNSNIINCSNSLILGDTNTCQSTSNTIMLGLECYNDGYVATIVRGNRAKADFHYGEFITAGRLDGSTTGSSQIFKGVPLMYRTTDTTPTVLTSNGSGTVSPLNIEEGYLYSFSVRLTGSLEGDGIDDEWETWIWDVEVWRNAVNGINHHINARYNYGSGGSGNIGTASWVDNDTDHTLELEVQAVTNTIKVDWYAHMWGGVKIQTLYDDVS
jgi:hypothetical protein